MKKLAVWLLAALMAVASACGSKDAQPAEKSALEVIKARTSIRSFTGEKLTEEQDELKALREKLGGSHV